MCERAGPRNQGKPSRQGEASGLSLVLVRLLLWRRNNLERVLRVLGVVRLEHRNILGAQNLEEHVDNAVAREPGRHDEEEPPTHDKFPGHFQVADGLIQEDANQAVGGEGEGGPNGADTYQPRSFRPSGSQMRLTRLCYSTIRNANSSPQWSVASVSLK